MVPGVQIRRGRTGREGAIGAGLYAPTGRSSTTGRARHRVCLLTPHIVVFVSVFILTQLGKKVKPL